MAYDLRRSGPAVFALVPAPQRPKRRGRLAWLAVGVAVLGGAVAVFATARAARVEQVVAPPAPVAALETHDAERQPVDAPWTIPGDPVERIGYRFGHQHVFEVVPLGPNGVEVEIRTAQAFLAMRGAAAAAGVELGLESGFRTAEQQQALFRAYRSGSGNKAARPGQSNHQSGRALDIVTSVPGALPWLEQNAALFGFKRTVACEPWHWEYVDMPIARGATKHVAKKSAKAKKVVGHATRPAQRASAPHHAAGNRVASSRR